MFSTRCFSSAAIGFISLLIVLSLSTKALAATVTPYSNQSNWQSAVGSFALENFESYSVGQQLTGLTNLGLSFQTLAGGGTPQIYQHPTPNGPHGSKHLGNFPNGINAINRFDDIVMTAMAGYSITGFGFWNGDGQAATMTATAYDASNNVMGAVGAFRANFAGMVTDMPISKIVFSGRTGDGWNHIDGLQTSFTKISAAIPLPATVWLLLAGLSGFVFAGLRRKSKQV